MKDQEKQRALGFPKNIMISYNLGATAPHLATTRLLYLVPDFRKAHVEFFYSSMMRFDAASVLRPAYTTLFLTPKIPTDYYLTKEFIVNSLSDMASGASSVITASDLTFYEGDQLTVYTQDFDVDGTVLYRAALKIIETDA